MHRACWAGQQGPLRRLANINDASLQDIADAREALQEAREAIQQHRSTLRSNSSTAHFRRPEGDSLPIRKMGRSRG